MKPRHPVKPRLSSFSKSLFEEWLRLQLPVAEADVIVAVSGGADSTALLLALNELIALSKLTIGLIVAHLDHGLRPQSREDAKWVKSLAKELGHAAVASRIDLKATKKAPMNLEQAARDARYEFLLKTAKRHRASIVLTGHTLDDQAETILLRLLRGSAAEGLTGMLAIRQLKPGASVQLVRPLLSWARRDETEAFCRQRQVDYRIDSMNLDAAFSRVRVRRELLPLMKSFNSRIVETLSRTASLLSEDATALGDDAKRLLGAATRESNNNETKARGLDVRILSSATPAVRRRALREWLQEGRGNLRRLEMVHLLAVEPDSRGKRGPYSRIAREFERRAKAGIIGTEG